jgi:SAM-dependent methyltransferase
MRVEHVRGLRARYSSHLEPLTQEGMGVEQLERFRLVKRESVRRLLANRVSLPLLLLCQRSIRSELGFKYPFPVTLFCKGQRWSQGAARARLVKLVAARSLGRVLVEGCHIGDQMVQFWLRRGVPHLDGIDILPFQECWRTTIPELRRAFGAQVSFQRASVDRLPFEDERFDLIASGAVLEHVRNLEAMARESARVIKPKGWAYHEFGPLYYSWGGDHCIATYGEASGYNHLLLTEPEYRRRVEDVEFFSRQPDPLCNTWANREQFSFARTEEYLAALSPFFDVRFLLVVISPQGLEFRRQHKEEWSRLLRSGLSEADLLTSSLRVILQKR